MGKVISIVTVITLLSLLLISCGEKKELPEQVRSIKTITISDQASGQIRKFTGKR